MLYCWKLTCVSYAAFSSAKCQQQSCWVPQCSHLKVHGAVCEPASDCTHLIANAMQVYDRFTVNNADSDLSGPPIPALGAKHGDFYYATTPTPDPWPHWSGGRYNSTVMSLFLSGPSDASLRVEPRNCAAAGCGNPASSQADNRAGTLYWSQDATWTGASPPMAVPKEVRGCLLARAQALGVCCNADVSDSLCMVLTSVAQLAI